MEVGVLTWLPSLMSSFSIASVRTSSSRLSGMERRKPGQTPAAKHTVSTIPRETASLPVNSTHLSVHAYTRPRLCHPRPIYTHTHTHTHNSYYNYYNYSLQQCGPFEGIGCPTLWNSFPQFHLV